MKKLVVIFIIVIYAFSLVYSQQKFAINGYISQMGSAQFISDSNTAAWDYVFQNRINTSYKVSENFAAHLEFRNQFLWGETIKLVPDYAQNFAKDKGVVDLNWNWYNSESTLLNTQIDRAYLDYTQNNFQFILGRQRINWGRSLVWNPNDIFNAYSYYEFDYPEKPGSDAVRAIYYSGTASSVEVVGKVDSANNLTIATLTKFNNWGYDIQFLGGYANSQDFVIGAGWEGNIKSFALRGEFNYYYPEKNFSDTLGVFLASIGTDISFGKSLMFQAEFLYNDKKTLAGSLNEFYAAPANSKSLSISEYNFFANVTYPITPILSVYSAAMYYTDQNGFFLMPGFDLSLTNNMNFSIIYQYFNIETFNNERLALNLAFARLKWNF